MKNLTWQNPEQLFVAQELINKVKSKCCGIKVEYKTDNKGNVVKRKVVDCNNKKFKSATLEAFDKVKNIRINKLQQTDTIYFQYKIQGSLTPIHPLTDVEIIGYGSYDIPILMK